MSDEERAFDEFVRARLPHLLRFGRALTGNDAAAATLVEDGLAPVLARWNGATARSAEDDVRRFMVGRFLRHRPPAGADDPETERDETTWEALARLSPKERTFVALRCHEDLTSGQVADVMGCSAGTVDRLSEHALRGLDEPRVRHSFGEPVTIDETRLLNAVRRAADRRRRRRRLGVAVLAATLVAALATGAVFAAQSQPEDDAPGLADPALSLAASDEDSIWAVTRDPGCAGCSILWAGDGTAEGWEQRYTFDQSPFAIQILMAPNGRDGWAWFGRDWLQATHDGGETWVIPGVDLRNGNVDIQLAGSTAWLLLHGQEGLHLLRSELGTDVWSEVPLPEGASDRYALSALDDQMFVVDYPRFDFAGLTPVSTPGARTPIPCGTHPLPPRSSAGALWVTCPDSGEGVEVKRSVDGSHWQSIGTSTLTAEDSFPVSLDATFVVTAGGGRVVGTSGTTDAELELESAESVDDGRFVTPEVGFLLTGQGRVLRTDDGGSTWAEIG